MQYIKINVNGKYYTFDKKGVHMFICNVNLHKNKLLKIFLYIFFGFLVVTTLLFVFSHLKNTNMVYITDNKNYEEILDIPSANYTNILKDSYDNIDNYIGKQIKFTGFVHRLYDFSDNQFVLAREMFTSPISNNQAEVVIVGFLCEYDGASSFKDKTWVEVEGTITKGFYHTTTPIVKVTNIKQANCPSDPFVNPPDGGYVGIE